MIVCPRCGAALDDEAGGYACRSCAYRATREDGIVFFNREILPDHEDYRAAGLDDLHQHERQHFWFAHRLNVISKAFHAYVAKHERILEVGAGTGYTARALRDDGYRDISLGEIHQNGLRYAQGYGLDKLYQFDLRAAPFREHFDVVALFDVIEHIREDEDVVKNLHAMLRDGGRVVLTVPAHRWLWSRIDELSGHHRRYDRRSMTALLERNGFDVLDCHYFFIALAPALMVRSLLARRTSVESIDADSGMTMSPRREAVFRLASAVGDAVLSPLRTVVGGSLVVVARKSSARA